MQATRDLCTEAEISKFHMFFLKNQNILCLDITMYVAEVMLLSQGQEILDSKQINKNITHHMLNGERQLLENLRRFGFRINTVLHNFIVKLATLNKLRHEVNPAQGLNDFKKPKNVRMLYVFQCFHFP